MKLLSYLKIISLPKGFRTEKNYGALEHNENELENISAITYVSHAQTYKVLRKFKTPQYDHVYVMRNKRGFNTAFFQQNYDVVITNRNNVVIEVNTNITPGYISPYLKEGYFIYFMTVGSINHFQIKEKDRLRVNRKIASQWL